MQELSGIEQNIQRLVGQLAIELLQRNWQVSAAESCTGGMLSMYLTELPGSSAWFPGSLVTYSNPLKTKWVAVDNQLLIEQGAVSEQVAVAMAEGALQAAPADIAVAISGIAGPDGGSTAKPVGTVCFALAQAAGQQSETLVFKGSRQQVRLQATEHALTLLIKNLS